MVFLSLPQYFIHSFIHLCSTSVERERIWAMQVNKKCSGFIRKKSTMTKTSWKTRPFRMNNKRLKCCECIPFEWYHTEVNRFNRITNHFMPNVPSIYLYPLYLSLFSFPSHSYFIMKISICLWCNFISVKIFSNSIFACMIEIALIKSIN